MISIRIFLSDFSLLLFNDTMGYFSYMLQPMMTLVVTTVNRSILGEIKRSFLK